MIFKRISYTIALQFMAFVFALLLITGGIFLGADRVNRGNQTRVHLEQMMRPLVEHPGDFMQSIASLPSFDRDRVRVINAAGQSIVSGSLYEDIPFVPATGMTTVNVEGENYDILTMPLQQDGAPAGYIQIGDRSPPDDLLFRAVLYLLISAGISGLTFGVGLFFARRSLKPAQEMMDRLEQFTQDASHELRTPLTAVSTSLDLALATQNYPENVRTAKKDLKEVTVLIERLLELARLDAFLLEKEKVDLSLLIADSVEKLRPFAAEKEVTITTHLAPGIHVQGDPTLIRQILNNLLTNAIKFNRKKGTIDVSLTAQKLIVHDTGIGIAETALPHIFDRFFQEEQSRTQSKGGLGLGLALVKRIVELHGWSISVQSVQGKGTTFTVHLS